MAWFKPQSTQTLVRVAIVALAGPLLMALSYATFYVGSLSDQGQEAVRRAVLATRDSRILAEQVTALERNARQYLLLRDATLLEAYRTGHERFERTANNVLDLTRYTAVENKVRNVIAAEQTIFNQITGGGAPNAEAITERFIALADRTDVVLKGANELIDAEVSAMESNAQRTQKLMLGLMLAMLVLTIATTLIFTRLLSPPLAQISSSIRRLGAGRFDQRIGVEGPQDLVELGELLEWLRTRLLDLENQKQRFLHHISHELKTPLTAIREGGDLLRDQVAGQLTPSQSEIVDILQQNARNLQSLIEDLLNFSTTQGLGIRLARRDADIKAIVDKVVRNHKPACMSKGVAIITEVPSRQVRLDPEKFATILDNLLSNAVKFTPEDGTIQLRAQVQDDQLCIDVLDSGPGIAPEDAKRIFEPFFQGRRKAAGYVKGSGLGLSIAREYAAAHGGRIQVLSPEAEQGGGAHIRVVIPQVSKKRHKAA